MGHDLVLAIEVISSHDLLYACMERTLASLLVLKIGADSVDDHDEVNLFFLVTLLHFLGFEL